MKESLFREKTTERMKSPEQLNDYIRVSHVGVWFVLTAVLILLVGFGVWGVFGNLETAKSISLISSGEQSATAYVSHDEVQNIEIGLPVEVDGKVVGRVNNVNVEAEPCVIEVETDLSAGVYDAKIIIERIKPMSFVLN